MFLMGCSCCSPSTTWSWAATCSSWVYPCWSACGATCRAPSATCCLMLMTGWCCGTMCWQQPQGRPSTTMSCAATSFHSGTTCWQQQTTSSWHWYSTHGQQWMCARCDLQHLQVVQQHSTAPAQPRLHTHHVQQHSTASAQSSTGTLLPIRNCTGQQPGSLSGALSLPQCHLAMPAGHQAGPPAARVHTCVRSVGAVHTEPLASWQQLSSVCGISHRLSGGAAAGAAAHTGG